MNSCIISVVVFITMIIQERELCCFLNDEDCVDLTYRVCSGEMNSVFVCECVCVESKTRRMKSDGLQPFGCLWPLMTDN